MAAPRIRPPRAPRLPSVAGGHIDRPPVEAGARRFGKEIEPTPFVEWDDFLAFHFDWAQGEHVTLVGPTGVGKTTLALQILPMRDYVVAVVTKQRDPVLFQLMQQGYVRTDKFEMPGEVQQRIAVVAQLPGGADTLDTQRKAVQDTLIAVYRQGGWCVYLDELRYVTDYLKLGRDVELLWQQGRSAGISLVGGMQRPAYVPLAAYDSATHLFFWRDNDKRNLERIGGLGAHDSQSIAHEVANLSPHVVLYVNTRTGDKLQTKVNV